MQDNNVENNNQQQGSLNQSQALSSDSVVTPPTQPIQAIQPTSVTEPHAKKSHKLIFIALAVFSLVVVSGIVYLAYSRSSNNPTNKDALKASDNFIKAIESNSAQSTYNGTADSFKSANSEAAFSNFAAKFSTLINPDYTVVISNNVTGNGSNKTATIIYNGQDKGTAKNEYIKVVLENSSGQWKVQSINYQQTPYGANQ
ncbi:MAG: hypothetical protein WCH00_01590 [Candidatus Saccharibacteria bacterium]